MKILHVIPSVAPVRGGPSQAVLQMVRELRSQGVEAEIATTNDAGDGLLDVPLHQRILYTEPGSSGAAVPVRFFPRYSPPIAPVREFAFSASLTRWLGHHLAAYDLVHVHAIFSYPSTAAMAIARGQGVPYIVRPLGQLCQWSLDQGRRKKQLYLDLMERQNLQGSRAMHFTSEQELGEARSLNLTSPGFVVPHGLTLPTPIPEARQQLRQSLQLPTDEPVLLFMSRLHPKKGLEYLIPALGELKAQRFTFVIAGTGAADYEAEIDRLLAAHGLADRTRRIGFASGDLKQLLLQGADLFALPSHSENFGIAVLEALAAGLPALVTPGVALADLIQRHSLGLVVQQDRQEIAAALQQGLQYPRKMRRMGDRARQVVRQEFTWERIASRLIQQYEGAYTTL
ncbi:glycosyl transferase family 1 [Leptolyngbya sp. 'hensonii']|uniref:glycosyltransferase n=1 Tax=Leptolyngbya sp. 'hensonii' TaxID=1922337 RepID=UPI00095022BE|nr:glycosyltransferase [Leptolyngbya sp. 'hensonii']OLP18911.1 glycosyl transferase family 1 [Leptolyngbya sp. 'hensonii']